MNHRSYRVAGQAHYGRDQTNHPHPNPLSRGSGLSQADWNPNEIALYGVGGGPSMRYPRFSSFLSDVGSISMSTLDSPTTSPFSSKL